MLGIESCQKRLCEIESIGQFHLTHSIGGNLKAGICRGRSFRHDNYRHDAPVTACFVKVTKVECVVLDLPPRLQTVRLVLGFEFETDNYVGSQRSEEQPPEL